jgi:hypothetical protein
MNLRNLTAADQQTICRELHLPLPTPDVSLDVIIAQEKITPADIITRLERSRDLKAMIACAALRGRVQKCPPDAQLTPKPWPKAPVARPKSAAEATRATPKATPKVRVASSTHTLVRVAPNPKRPGSAARDRYALYQTGLTEAELLAKGVTASDLRWDLSRGYIAWST